MNRSNFGELTEKRQVRRLKIEYQYIWVIKNLKSIYSIHGVYDESPIFILGQNNEYKWKLKIYLAGYNGNSGSNSIDICPFLIHKTSHDNVTFFVELSVLDRNNQEKNTQKRVLTMADINVVERNFQYFLVRDKLLKDANLLPNGDLRISCRFYCDAPCTVEETIEMQYSQCYQNSQLDNFEQLYGNIEFSDFKLVISKSEFPVHQAILAARSPVFKAMFLSNMRESREKKLEIDDVDPEIMKKVLRYIYSGRVGNIQDIADKVLPVADKYQLDGLKQICEDLLVDQLSTENIYEILKFSDNFNATKLKMRALDFFFKNYEKLSTADDFKSTISSLPPNLQTDIICAPAKKN